MAMDPKNLTPEERAHLQTADVQERLSQLLYEARNKMLRTSQNKINHILLQTPPADRTIICQAAFEACVIMALRYQEDLRGAGMPALLIEQCRTEAVQMGIETMLGPAPSGIILPGSDKNGR